MKKLLGVLLVCAIAAVVILAEGYPLSIVRHRWQEVITESNHAALRPGSVYDILTHFEQNFGRARPQFKYLFFDTGLGAADPIGARVRSSNTCSSTQGWVRPIRSIRCSRRAIRRAGRNW